MFDDSITLTIYESTQRSPTNLNTATVGEGDDDEGEQGQGKVELSLEQAQPTVKSLGGSSISPVKPGNAAIGTTTTTTTASGGGAIGPAVGEGADTDA